MHWFVATSDKIWSKSNLAGSLLPSQAYARAILPQIQEKVHHDTEIEIVEEGQGCARESEEQADRGLPHGTPRTPFRHPFWSTLPLCISKEIRSID